MKVYKTRTVRLAIGHHDEELDAWINAAVEDGWDLHSVGDGVPTVVAGGARAVDRLLVFVRDEPGEDPLIVESSERPL